MNWIERVTINVEKSEVIYISNGIERWLKFIAEAANGVKSGSLYPNT